MIATISVATCTASIFVLLERYALENPRHSQIPCWLRWLDLELTGRRKKSQYGQEAGNELVQERESLIDNSAENRDIHTEMPDSMDSRRQVSNLMSFYATEFTEWIA